jgi:hypothetical protein
VRPERVADPLRVRRDHKRLASQSHRRGHDKLSDIRPCPLSARSEKETETEMINVHLEIPSNGSRSVGMVASLLRALFPNKSKKPPAQDDVVRAVRTASIRPANHFGKSDAAHDPKQRNPTHFHRLRASRRGCSIAVLADNVHFRH